MSMEICVFSDLRPDSLSNWQKALDAEGFALRLSGDQPIAGISGFLSASLQGADVYWFFHERTRTMGD